MKKGTNDCVQPHGKHAGELPTAAFFHNLPEFAMLRVPTAVISHGRANGFRNPVQACHQLIDRESLKIGMSFQSLVQVVDVGAMVFSVVNLHRQLVNIGLQRIGCVRGRGKNVGQGTLLLWCSGLLLCHRCLLSADWMITPGTWHSIAAGWAAQPAAPRAVEVYS